MKWIAVCWVGLVLVCQLPLPKLSRKCSGELVQRLGVGDIPSISGCRNLATALPISTLLPTITTGRGPLSSVYWVSDILNSLWERLGGLDHAIHREP